jgi:phosphopantothenoylcysteine decarboxylase/phosphopantothenate--cysteine ligase
MVAPAMNKQMWENPATQRNINQLKKDGVVILGPDSGDQACGEVGMGRMLEPEQLLAAIEASQQPKILAGKRILITAGPTFEAIDPVRAITNMSSGKMGYSIAQAAWEMGAEVTLISGPTALNPPPGTKVINVVSAQDMLTTVTKNIAKQDIFISVAAVADYRVAKSSIQKIKRTDKNLTLELSPNADILVKVACLPNAPFCVGFAAESENLLKYAEQKRLKKRLPLIVANLVQDALGKDDTALTLLDNKGKHILPKASKIESARLLLQHVAAMLQESKTKAKPKMKAWP